ncbi:MAG: 2-succinyl-6-hydroxy-2,4-cyclohexadiene-1-carboxylate synthase [Flavobacteriaceae bacterium]|nr:MAG: 2-succinyl-6-hydroxy-2,4-cyclohexadiene-1-carboxylate synthase [Flavobacteriaceae bacterium]
MKQLITKSIGFFLNAAAVIAPGWAANFAFNLLCKVRRAGISEKGKAFFEKATQHTLLLEKNTAVLHKWGSGPKNILFLHGWESNSQRWLPYYNMLEKEKYTIYALDAPGHGMSGGDKLNVEVFRQAIEAALARIGPIDTIIGHSLSNTAVGYCYIMNPNVDVKKFIVMGAASGMDAVFTYFKEILGLSRRSVANLSKKVNAIFKIPHQEVKLMSFLDKVTQPVLVIHDKNDAVTPFKPIENVLKKHPKINTYITCGLKHDLKAEEVYAKVIAFIDS